MNLDEMKIKLQEFIDCNKFVVYQEWQPAVENSTPDTVQLVNGIFNDAANKLLVSINTNGHNEKEMKKILLKMPSILEKQRLDTEDFEFCFELIIILGKIVNIDIGDEL